MITTICIITSFIYVACIIVVSIWANLEWRKLSPEEKEAVEKQIKQDGFIW